MRTSKPSSQGEFHPKALTEPYVTVSRHTALVADAILPYFYQSSQLSLVAGSYKAQRLNPFALSCFHRLSPLLWADLPRLPARVGPCRVSACAPLQSRQIGSLVPLQRLTRRPATLTPPAVQPVSVCAHCTLSRQLRYFTGSDRV